MRILFLVSLLSVSLWSAAQVKSGTIVSLSLNQGIFAPAAKVGQVAEFTVLQEVVVDGKVLIPKSAKVRAAVVDVNKGGPHQPESRLKVMIYDVTAADGTIVVFDDCYMFVMGDGGHKQRGALLEKGTGKNCIVK